MAGISNVSSDSSESVFHSLPTLRVVIEPRRVKVLIAKTDIVTMESMASATRLDLKTPMMYA